MEELRIWNQSVNGSKVELQQRHTEWLEKEELDSATTFEVKGNQSAMDPLA